MTNFDATFLGSKAWIAYSHQSYLPLRDIQRRLHVHGREWESYEKQFVAARKQQSIPFLFRSFGKQFWYFEADCIKQSISRIEESGKALWNRFSTIPETGKAFVSDAVSEEAITSAIYEGANSTRAKAQQLIAEGRTPRTKDEYMVVNNFLTMEWLLKNYRLPITLERILTIHAMITRRTLSEDLIDYSGKWRNDRVFVGDHEGISHELIPEAIEEALAITLQHPRILHPLVMGTLLHYFIAYIHPFFDGNGRTARTLFYWVALQHETQFVQLLSFSAYLLLQGAKYEKTFSHVVTHGGDVTYFVTFALEALEKGLGIVAQKTDYLFRFLELKKKFHLQDSQIILLQKLALNRYKRISISEHAKDCQKTHEAARLELKALVATGFIRESKEGKKLLYTVNRKELDKAVLG